jgi:transcriptional antiterminator NusG
MSRAWYVICGYSGYENSIEKNIRNMMGAGVLDKNVVFDVRIPIETVSEIRDGKKRSTERKLLPGYILIELDINDVNWKDPVQKIRTIPGVTCFLGSSGNVGKPRPLSAEEARAQLARTGDTKTDRIVRSRTTFAEGEQVKITDGPFESFTGTIDEVNNDKTKLKVMVGIFGRNTPVEVDFTQVEKV